MQRRVVLWIIGAFCTSSTWRVEAIAGIIPIYFYLDKIIGQHYLWIASLPKQHAINTLVDEHHSKKTLLHCMATSHLTAKQWSKVKSSIMDINNCLNKVLHYFDSLNKELSLGFHSVNTFLDHFSFVSVN